jgi:hypothetical protein
MTLKSIRAVAFCSAAVFTMAFAASAAPPSVSAAYQGVVTSYYNALWVAHSTTATAAGLHNWDAQIDDTSAAAITAEIARLKDTQAKLRAIDGAKLAAMDRDDRDVLLAQIDGQLLQDETIQGWRHDPGTYVNLATNAAFQLIERDFAPLPERMKNLVARENRIPALFAQAKANLTNIPPVYIDIALENLDGGISFLGKDVPAAFAGVKDAGLQQQLAASTKAAVAAANDFKTWMIAQKPNAHGSFVLGRASLQRLLATDMVDVPVEKVLAAGEAQFAKDHADFLTNEKLIDPKNPSKALAEVGADHPDAAHMIPVARDGLTTLQHFITEHHILTLPSQMLPTVAATPVFQRAVIFGQLDPPGPLETHATKAYYDITPPDPKWPVAKQNDLLAYFNHALLQNLSVHEALPGHYTQFLFARANPNWSLVRKMAGSYTVTEGWAHYSEQMMLDEGLSAGDPKVKLSQLQDALLRDCRLIASIKMHTGVMTLEQATQMMQTQCFQPPSVAPGEARRGTNDPGYYSYTLGKLEILKLRADAQKKEGKAFSLTKFHDAFLNAGLVPVAIIRREMGVEGSAL